MKLKTEYSPLVLVGAWNKHIFNPEWVGKFLLPGKELEVEFPLNVDGSPRISTEDLRIFVLNNKLNFSLRKDNDNVLEEIEDLSLKIADYLPHTPVASFGINFLFECNSNCNNLNDLFSLCDTDKLIELGCIISSNEIKHSFTLEERRINLTIIKGNEAYNFNFNFHFDVKDLVQFKDMLNNNRIIDIKQKAISILGDIYGVE